MIADLVRRREKPNLFSRRWLKVWCKRLFHIPGLIELYFFVIKLKSRGVVIGSRVFLSKVLIFGPGGRLCIGDETFIGGPVIINLQGSVRIGSRVVINDGVRIISGSHDVKSEYWEQFGSEVVIEDYAWVATGAMILPGAKIGRGAVVGAGAVVRGVVEPGSVVIGNPAKSTGVMRPNNLKYQPTRGAAAIEAWLGPVEGWRT